MQMTHEGFICLQRAMQIAECTFVDELRAYASDLRRGAAESCERLLKSDPVYAWRLKTLMEDHADRVQGLADAFKGRK